MKNKPFMPLCQLWVVRAPVLLPVGRQASETPMKKHTRKASEVSYRNGTITVKGRIFRLLERSAKEQGISVERLLAAQFTRNLAIMMITRDARPTLSEAKQIADAVLQAGVGAGLDLAFNALKKARAA